MANGADPCIVDKKGKTARKGLEENIIIHITDRKKVLAALKEIKVERMLEKAEKKCKRHRR